MKAFLSAWWRRMSAPAIPQAVLTTLPPSTFGLAESGPTIRRQRGREPDYVDALTMALERRPLQRHQLRSLITVESTLRYAPDPGLRSVRDGVLIRALKALETFEELSTDRDLQRLERRMLRCLADRQAARPQADRVGVPLDTEPLPFTTMTPRCELRRTGAPTPVREDKTSPVTAKW